MCDLNKLPENMRTVELFQETISKIVTFQDYKDVFGLIVTECTNEFTLKELCDVLNEVTIHTVHHLDNGKNNILMMLCYQYLAIFYKGLLCTKIIKGKGDKGYYSEQDSEGDSDSSSD